MTSDPKHRRAPIPMKTYKPESSFQTTGDGSMVYNLRATGRFYRGQEQWENDVEISITARTEEQRAEIAELIRETMNAQYPHNGKVLAPEGPK
jgi:hypothetical protein